MEIKVFADPAGRVQRDRALMFADRAAAGRDYSDFKRE
jgi:hypothetical protein